MSPIKGLKRGEKRYNDGLTPGQRYYQRNKAKVLQKAREQRAIRPVYRGPGERSNVDFVRYKKQTTPCTDCKRYFPACVMDFDHVKGEKLYNVGLMMSLPREAILEEISKCELVCSNCHRLRTRARANNKRYQKTSEYMSDNFASNSAESFGG